MSGCKCHNPTDFRATNENGGDEHLYLRCADCGGKCGTVEISTEDLFEKLTNPNALDPERPDVAEKTVEHGVPTVSIHFESKDSPFTWKGEE